MKPITLLAAGALLLAAPTAFAKTCKLEVDSNDQMQFVQKELKVAADCSKVELTLRHVGKLPATAMGHNWVLAKTADYRPLAIAGARATAADSYLPPGDKRAIAHTKVIGGGETATVTFATSALQKGGAYTFFCSFPGHWGTMKGTLVFG